jgi:hypothetical protein
MLFWSVAMDRTRPLRWSALLFVVAISLVALGHTCPASPRAAAPEAPALAAAPPEPAYAESAPPAVAAAEPPPAEKSPEAEWPDPPAPAEAAAPDAVFEATVRPVLAERCAPCHNPGGQMYARLPWDQASVVAANSAGIKRRLKGDDLKALEAWLAARSPS